MYIYYLIKFTRLERDWGCIWIDFQMSYNLKTTQGEDADVADAKEIGGVLVSKVWSSSCVLLP